jgi:integrase
MLCLPRTTLRAKYNGKTTPQIIAMADHEDKVNRDRHGADAPRVPRVASKTAERDVSAVAAVLNYGENNGYFGDGVFSPFRGITVDTSDGGRWHSFTQPQLTAIFSDSIFSESTWGADQWMIALGYATGAREEELGALLISDIIDGGNEEKGQNWYLSITNIDRSLKTETSRRNMPIHRGILENGFLNYYEKRRERGEAYLLDLDEYRGSRTQKWSKWFNQTFLVRNNSKTKVHVFHSWRHTFTDLMRESKIEDRVQDALTGHKPVGMNPRYGSGQPLSVLREAIDRIELPFLTKLLRPGAN